MSKVTTAIGALGLLATSAFADSVPPQDVVFGEYGEVEASLTGVPGDPAAGRNVFSSRAAGNCVACHTVTEMIDDVAWHGNIGPPLDGIGDIYTAAELRGIVINAKNIYEGTIMPSFYKVSGFIRPGEGFTTKPATEPLPPLLSAEQIENVVAYLVTLRE